MHPLIEAHRDSLERYIARHEHDIKSRVEWADRGWVSESTRDDEIANLTDRIESARFLLGVLNRVPVAL